MPHALPTSAATASIRASSASRPSRANRSSVPGSFRNATVTWRCSASPLATARWSRSGPGTYSCRSAPSAAGGGGIVLAPGSSRVISRAPSRSSPTQPGSSAAAVSALTTISPALARSSSSKTRVAAGPATSSSRCGSRVRRNWQGPLWTPADMRSSTGPTELSALPTASIVHCMSDAAPHARSGWRSPVKRSSSASPRNLSTSPPCRSATAMSPSKTSEIRVTSSSAPAFPFVCSLSASAVKPEMSTETSEPSTTRARGLSGSSLQARTSRGR